MLFDLNNMLCRLVLLVSAQYKNPINLKSPAYYIIWQKKTCHICIQGQLLTPRDIQRVAFCSFWWCSELFTHNMRTWMHVANTTRRPGRLRLIHMQMWGGAGAKKREEMSPSESSTGERSERGKETACSEGCRGEDRLLFLQREALHCWGKLQKWVSIHGDRWQMPEKGRWMEEWQLTLRHTMRRRWGAGWGRFCRWTDGEECDSSVLLCFSFSHSCTDPGWVYSGSPSCRGSGPSPTPSSSGPSSHSLQAWSHSTLPETQHCPEPLHNPSEGGGWGSDFPCSALQHAHTYMPTRTHTYNARTGERCRRCLL